MDLSRARTCRHARWGDCHWLCASSKHSAMGADDTDQCTWHSAAPGLAPWHHTQQGRRGCCQQNPQSQQAKQLLPALPPSSKWENQYLLGSKCGISPKTTQLGNAMAICRASSWCGGAHTVSRMICDRTWSALPRGTEASRGVWNSSPVSWHDFPGFT